MLEYLLVLVVYIEALYAQKTSYPTAMALTALSVFILASVMAAVGKESVEAIRLVSDGPIGS